jgi:hemolysin activation/secretion protein
LACAAILLSFCIEGSKMSVYALGTRLVVASLYFLAMDIAVAAPTPGDTDLIRERQDRLLEEQRRRLEQLKELPGKPATPQAPVAPTDNRCFPIKTIELKSADALSERERQRLLAPYINQCLGVPQLNELLKTITDAYLEKGLLLGLGTRIPMAPKVADGRRRTGGHAG